MHSVAFRSNAPFNHLPRALDLLHRMSFGLVAVHADQEDTGDFLVRVSFIPTSTRSAQTFVDRLRQMPGLHILNSLEAQDIEFAHNDAAASPLIEVPRASAVPSC